MRISDWSSDVCSSDLLLQTYIRNIRHAQGIVTPAGGTAASGSGDMAAPILSERNAMRVLDRKVYAMGDVIFRTGQAGYSAFLVQSGDRKSTRLNSSH